MPSRAVVPKCILTREIMPPHATGAWREKIEVPGEKVLQLVQAAAGQPRIRIYLVMQVLETTAPKKCGLPREKMHALRGTVKKGTGNRQLTLQRWARANFVIVRVLRGEV